MHNAFTTTTCELKFLGGERREEGGTEKREMRGKRGRAKGGGEADDGASW